MKLQTPNSPTILASWMIYLGGLAMVFGNAVFHEQVWPSLWYGGEWTIAFAVLYYSVGWWRQNY
jgi:hypothetical protein